MTREEAREALSVLKIYDAPWLREAIDMAIEALSERNIARDIATILENEQDMRVILQNAKRPQGEWIDREHCQVDEDAYEIATCSHCKAEITLEYPNDNYCPNCGAIMKGGAE